MLQGAAPPDPALDWQAWFRAFLYDGRPAIDPYPGVAKWLIMHGPTFPSIRGFFDAGISTLERAGFPQPALVYALLVNTAMLTITMSDDRLESGDDGPRDHASMLRDFSAMNVESSGISRMIRGSSDHSLRTRLGPAKPSMTPITTCSWRPCSPDLLRDFRKSARAPLTLSA